LFQQEFTADFSLPDPVRPCDHRGRGRRPQPKPDTDCVRPAGGLGACPARSEEHAIIVGGQWWLTPPTVDESAIQVTSGLICVLQSREHRPPVPESVGLYGLSVELTPHKQGRPGTFRAHSCEIWPETMRITEISAAGQHSYVEVQQPLHPGPASAASDLRQPLHLAEDGEVCYRRVIRYFRRV
jgi:hypothetical protein